MKIWASRAVNSVKIWQNLPISNPKPDLHNINAHTKFNENPLMFTQVIIQKRKMDRWTDGRTDDWQTDRHTDIQRETLIPRHYCVAGYKKTCIKVYEELQSQGTHCLYIWGQKMTKFTKLKKVTKINARIISKAHAYLQAMEKKGAKFQKD